MPKVPGRILQAGGTLLKELDAPSSVAEFANVQAKLESETKDTADKMEGGCLREFTRFLEKEVRAVHKHELRGTHLGANGHILWSLQSLYFSLIIGSLAQVGRPAAGAAPRGSVGVVLQGLHRHHQRGH